MKPEMLLALFFLHFALTTIAIFPGGAVAAQQTSATVLDIYGEPVLTGAEYYIYYPYGFHVAGLSERGDRVQIHFDGNRDGIPVIISQGQRSEVVVDTALEIRFNKISNASRSPYWKLSLEPDKGYYYVTIGGYNEGYKFTIEESGERNKNLYGLTYSPVSPFCYNATSVAIGLLYSYFAAYPEEPIPFMFVPIKYSAGIRTPLLK